MAVDAASRRLEAAAARAERAGDVEAFISLVHSRYRRAQETGRPEEAAALGEAARRPADTMRGRFRSRGGRLWAAQRLDETLADFLIDELAEGPLDDALFARVEGLKARTLLDALQHPGAAGDPPPEAEEAETALMRFAPPRE